ncbi:MAG: DJ-1/PfpI family protein [Armatimonadota bacterium]|nr:MAG: DJ-1/PfpI family protein [Armatimonadota bacterium]
MRSSMLLMMLTLLLACGCAQQTPGQQGGESGAARTPAAEDNAGAERIEGKTVVMIVAHRNFRDEELFKPRSILEEAGARVTVASSSLDPAKGTLGGTVKPDTLVRHVDARDYDAVVFVGGPGAKEYWEDEKTHGIARQAAEEGKVLAAICIAPVTLANAGLLKGKKATVWKSEAERLKAKGALYTGSDVETDGRIVTADGPEAAEKFGRALVKALSG